MGPEINTGGGSALAYPSACHSLDWRGGLRLRHRGLARPHIQTRGQERLPVPVVFGRSENAAAATATPFDSFSSQKELAELLNETRLGFGRTIALWGFIALQQICCELDARVGVEDWVIAAECRIATCPAKSYHGSAYPRSGFRSTPHIVPKPKPIRVDSRPPGSIFHRRSHALGHLGRSRVPVERHRNIHFWV